MTTSTSSVAVLLFARSEGQEAAHKRFVSYGGPAINAAVAAQLTAHAVTTAQQLGVDFLHVDSSRQTGATFGERLSGAMQQAFSSGYERLLVIGSDCPQLDTPLLRRALAVLVSNGVVLGPATDGGVYLLGVARTHFDASTWAALPWQTAILGQSLAAHLKAAGAIVQLLPRLADVDSEQDLAQVLRQKLAQPLLRVLRRLRRLATAPLTRNLHGVPQVAFAVTCPHRGPPNY